MIDTNIGEDDVVRETDKAILIEVRSGYTQFGGSRDVWLPKSQIEWRTSPGQEHFAPTLHMPFWLASQKSLV